MRGIRGVFLLIIAAVMLVRPVYGTDGSAELRAALEEYLARHFPQMISGVEVRILRTSVDRSEGLVPILPARKGIPRAHTRFELADASGDRAGWVLTYVAHFDSVVLPVHNMSRGAELTPADVEFAWMETTTFRGEPLTAQRFRAITESEETILNRPARRGRPLLVEDLRAAFTAVTGQSIEMLHNLRGVEIRLRCTVREPGHTRDLVRVHCSETGRVYRARVIDPSIVEWVETL